MSQTSYHMSPIGRIRLDDDTYRVEIVGEYRAALTGLEGFSHAIVVWWCHLFDDPDFRHLLTCEKPYRRSPAELGVFATRSPLRPNPIALSVVAVDRIDDAEGVIHIPYIDAEDESPVLDIKPYHPCLDRVREASVPQWCAEWPAWYEDSADYDWASELTSS